MHCILIKLTKLCIKKYGFSFWEHPQLQSHPGLVRKQQQSIHFGQSGILADNSNFIPWCVSFHSLQNYTTQWLKPTDIFFASDEFVLRSGGGFLITLKLGKMQKFIHFAIFTLQANGRVPLPSTLRLQTLYSPTWKLRKKMDFNQNR